MLNINRIDNITTVAMAHGKVNVMDLELCRAVAEAVRQEDDSAAIILTGEGRAFSAGLDLFRLVKGGPPYVEEFVVALADMFMAVFNHPGPAVAAINGHAIAGGCVIAAACDQRIMAMGKGRIGIPELQIGVSFPVEALEIMRFVLPSRYLSEVVYGGGTWQSAEAMERGLVDSVCDASQLLARASAAASHMAAIPARVFAVSKQQLHRSVLDNIASMQSLNDEAMACWQEPATLEMIADYLERMVKKT